MQVIMSMDEYESMQDQIEGYEKDIDELNQKIDKLDQMLEFNLIKDVNSNKISISPYGVNFIPAKYKECTSLTINRSEIINYIKEKYESEVPKDFKIVIK